MCGAGAPTTPPPELGVPGVTFVAVGDPGGAMFDPLAVVPLEGASCSGFALRANITSLSQMGDFASLLGMYLQQDVDTGNKFPVDLSAYAGIEIWIAETRQESAGGIFARFEMADTNLAPPEAGGTCVGLNCFSYFGSPSFRVTPGLAKKTLCFADMVQGGSVQPTDENGFAALKTDAVLSLHWRIGNQVGVDLHVTQVKLLATCTESDL